MVVICNKPFTEDLKYEEFWNYFPLLELSNFQKYSIKAIIEGHHSLITAHTGSGKTLPAEFAILYFIKLGKKVIYTCPIKALSNTKLSDLRSKYPDISFGILTGDISDNPDADVLIMTTEILPNTLVNKKINKEMEDEKQHLPLSFEMDFDNDLAAVIFDEVHYINDRERGGVWEQAILMLPSHIQLIMLSATIDKPEVFANWIENEKNKHLPVEQYKKVYLSSSDKRIVPLSHYLWITVDNSVIKDAKNTEYEEKLSIINKPILLKSSDNQFNETNYHNSSKVLKYINNKKQFSYVKRQFVLDRLIRYLRANNGLPALCFIFSRRNTEIAASEINFSLFEKDSIIPSTIEKECRNILSTKLINFEEYLNLEEYKSLIKCLRKGIAYHHAGILSVFREMIEILFERKMIKLLFATETLAVGINFSTTSVIFTNISKFDGTVNRLLEPHEYTQIAGRAGRRGIDEVGKVWLCANLFPMDNIIDFKHMLCGPPQSLISKFKISFVFVLNTFMCKGNKSELFEFANKSMICNDINKEIIVYRDEIKRLLSEIERVKKYSKITNELDIIKKYGNIELEILNTSGNKKKKLINEKRKLESSYENLAKDLQINIKLNNLEEDIKKNNEYIGNAKSFLSTSVDRTIELLRNNYFIDESDSTTLLGKIAGQIQEVHPLVLSSIILHSNYFHDLSSEELVGLFSSFINLTISDELKNYNPVSISDKVNIYSNDITKYMNYYYDEELKYNIQSGSDYQKSFELQTYCMRWCRASDELSCKEIICDIKKDLHIFLGEFIKVLLKINNIASEIECIAEFTNRIDLLEKVKAIPSMTLKYIVTNQSLYL